MKLGLGLYNHQLHEDYYTFARQAGCTHLIIHLVTYYNNKIVPATDDTHNYGESHADDGFWTPEFLEKVIKEAGQHDLTVAGIENFNPADWYDVLLDGPRRSEQMEKLKGLVQLVGEHHIPIIGYNFSLAGVWGHQRKAVARGGAVSACFDAAEIDPASRVRNGEVWNMTYDASRKGVIPDTTQAQLWDRLSRFLNEILPVAEKAGVELALHPDDPPFEGLRHTPRLVYEPDLYQKVIDINRSPSNKLEFCMGSIQEMSKGSLYDAIRQYGEQRRISYVHFRNVRGKVPKYDEVFIDEGDIDMLKALRIFKQCNFDGVFIPDHTPSMQSTDSWKTGMAFALGYMKALFTVLEEEK